MEVGLLNKKVVFVIQARMKSTRLPGKILLPIPLANGKPLLSWIIDELKESKFSNEIIIATSINPENDVLVPFCDINGISCFRGDEDDVLSRFISVAKKKSYDCIVRLTGDNPIIDISLLDDSVKKHFIENNDYTRTEGLPIGMNFEILSSKALIDCENHELTDSEREHVTLFVKNNNNLKKGCFTCNISESLKGLRLTIDYPSDFLVLCTLMAFYNKNLRGLILIEHIYNIYPWLFDGNSGNIQKKQYNILSEEIQDASFLLDKFDFKNASEILRNF